MAYYFTNDRGLIIIIGIMYGFQCILLTSYCLYFVMKYFTLMIMKDKTKDDLKGTPEFTVIFVVTILVYIAFSRQTNFQNYIRLPYLITSFLAFTFILCVVISIISDKNDVNEMMPYIYYFYKL